VLAAEKLKAMEAIIATSMSIDQASNSHVLLSILFAHCVQMLKYMADDGEILASILGAVGSLQKIQLCVCHLLDDILIVINVL